MRIAVLCWSLLIVSTLRGQVDTSRPISNDEFAQQETSLAISRSDPNVIVVGSNDDAMDVRSMPAYVTTDGGRSWDTFRLPKSPLPYGAIGDPVVIADNDGGFYYAYLLFHDATSWYNILVAHSNDGRSWTYNAPVIKEPTGAYEDKEWIALDRSKTSPTYGRLYVSWTRLHPGIHSESGTFISWSDDTGKTWTSAKRIGSFVGTYTQVHVGDAGEVYISYSQYSEYEDSIGHYMSVSYDFGETFTEMLIAKFINYPFSLGIAKSALKGGRLVSFPYLSFALDRKKHALHAIYGSYDTGKSAATQLYVYSTNDGASWSSPKIIGDPTTIDRDRYQPWIALDELKSEPHIFYYSSERDPKNLLTSVYRARVESDTILIQGITDTLFNPLRTLDFNNDPFIGDYTGADLSARTFAASWTQNRTGYTDGEIFFYADHNIDSLTRSVTTIIRPARFYIESVAPNPITTNSCVVRIISLIASTAHVQLVDLYGKILSLPGIYIGEGVTKVDLSNLAVPAGVYILRISTNVGTAAAKVIIQ